MQVLSCGGSMSNVEDPSTPFRCRNDKNGGRVWCFRKQFRPFGRGAAAAGPYGFAGGWYRSTAQVVFGTWRAADCRPYVKFVTNTVYLTHITPVLRSKKRKNVVHYRRGGNLAARHAAMIICVVERNHQYTEPQCSGDDPSPRNATNTTRTDE